MGGNLEELRAEGWFQKSVSQGEQKWEHPEVSSDGKGSGVAEPGGSELEDLKKRVENPRASSEAGGEERKNKVCSHQAGYLLSRN